MPPAPYSICFRTLIFLLMLALLPVPARVHALVIDGNRIMDQGMSENLCALTFDDGPSRLTPRLLDMLRDYGIPATFFLLGSQAQRHPDVVRRILAEGHEVGNHSWSHPNLRTLAPERQEEEIRATDALLRALGATPAFLRPPYGAYDASTRNIAETLGLGIMLWSLDSHDWKQLPPDYAKLRSARGTLYEQGDLRGIFLFHDTHRNTVEDLPRIIANLRAGGCRRFVTVSDYLAAAADPEPGLLMTRRPDRESTAPPALAVQHRRFNAQDERSSRAVQAVQANTGRQDVQAGRNAPATGVPIPLARCSRAWDEADAQAAAPASQLHSDVQSVPTPPAG